MKIEEQNQRITEVRAGNQDSFRSIYEHYRDQFMAWCFKQKDMDNDTARELYQMTMMILYNNIIDGKLESVRNDLSQYIIQIGKLKFMESLRKNKKVVHSMEDYMFQHEEEDESEAKAAQEAKINIMNKALDQLGDSCQKILRAFYFLKSSMTDIAEKYQFKNADTVKNMKYKCVKQLQKAYYTIQ